MPGVFDRPRQTMFSPAALKSPPPHEQENANAQRSAYTPLTDPHTAKRREPLSLLSSPPPEAPWARWSVYSAPSPCDSTSAASIVELSQVPLGTSLPRGRLASLGSDVPTESEKGGSSLLGSSRALFDVRVMGVEAEGSVRWYRVRLVYRLRPNFSWEVTRRFSQFDALAQGLTQQEDTGLPAMPRKLPQLLLTPTEEQRRILGLQRYCQALLSTPELLGHATVSKFFDLSFGLWHATSSPPLRLDRAQERAACLIQAQMRRFQASSRILPSEEDGCDDVPNKDGIVDDMPSKEGNADDVRSVSLFSDALRDALQHLLISGRSCLMLTAPLSVPRDANESELRDTALP